MNTNNIQNENLDEKRSDSLNKFVRMLWGAALLTLPVTSFRWFPLLSEGTFVRPLALYPLALLISLLLIQILIIIM